MDGHGAAGRAGEQGLPKTHLEGLLDRSLEPSKRRKGERDEKKKCNERDGRLRATPGVMARLVNRWEFDVVDVGGCAKPSVVDSGPSRKCVVGLRVAGVI